MINGDIAALQEALNRDPALVRARSSRICCFDPAVHRATLLRYMAASGVEAALLQPDASADMCGDSVRRHEHAGFEQPPGAGCLQAPLLAPVLEFGAAIE